MFYVARYEAVIDALKGDGRCRAFTASLIALPPGFQPRWGDAAGKGEQAFSRSEAPSSLSHPPPACVSTAVSTKPVIGMGRLLRRLLATDQVPPVNHENQGAPAMGRIS
jgi:hypothetical protein